MKRTGLVALLLLALLGGGWLYTPDKPRAELEARYATPPSEFVELMGLRLHLRDSAPQAGPERPVVLMLHGFGGSLHTWEDWAAGLAATHRVIRLDLPGAGLTGADPSGDYSDERGFTLLAALLTQRGAARTTVLGHSMGGRLAWRFAAAMPERVERLVLVAPDGFASPGFDYGKPVETGVVARLLPQVLPRMVLRWSLAPAYADPERVMTEALVSRYHDLLLAPGVRPAILARLAQLNLLPPPLLRTIQAPTLLLWGEQDQMIPLANAQDYLQALPHARLATLPRVGHVPHEDAPAAGLAAVQAFLAEAR